VVAALQQALADAQKKKEKASSDADRLSAASLFEDAKANLKAVSACFLIVLLVSLREFVIHDAGKCQ
jgi:hypothetical protein